MDEDDLPGAFLRIAHEDSENEVPLNVNSSDSENSSDESEDESDDSKGNSNEVYSNLRWSSRHGGHTGAQKMQRSASQKNGVDFVFPWGST